MKKNDLIQKWLDHNLNEEELEAFKQMDAYSSLQQIDSAAQFHKAPAYDSEAAYQKLQRKIQADRRTRFPRYLIGVAAVLVVALGVYLTMFTSDTTTYTSLAAIKENIELPDASEVTLLPNSSIQFDGDTFDKARAISLKGAAFFDVEKGTTFTVKSDHGLVTVLGTQFSVKDWGSYYEVSCYEGSVKVDGPSQHHILTAGMTFTNIDGAVSVESVDPASKDNIRWSPKFTDFDRVPVAVVLRFIEKNYGVTIQQEKEMTGLFTGKIGHTHLEEALQMVTIPFQYTYEIRNATVILKSE
ncbi:MAG: FecR domain-containing protein [Marinirhabdus sp.]|nr:FecR domain-containing protein [Marinirhabdus sp.]